MTHDLILVGGGLQNGLLLLLLRADLRVLLLEQASRLGGNHTWSFQASDLSQAARAAFRPLVVVEHEGYDVRFPGLERHIASGYSVVTSERFAEVIGARTGDGLRLGARVVSIEAPEVRLESGEVFSAPLIVDARGPDHTPPGRCGYQKFVGLELAGSGPSHPIVMDATVPQEDGFRFVYTLPLGPDRVLVEDTYYSDGPDLDVAALAERCRVYARERFGLREVVRQEAGVLPIPFEPSPPPHERAGLVLGGYQGGWFHPTTGYSFPVCARLAEAVATGDPAALSRAWRHQVRQTRFCRLLNRMLFENFSPSNRRNVLEHFYRLPEDTIGRFYALRLETRDMLRILCRRPPRGLRVST